jgi:hypothetical protein
MKEYFCPICLSEMVVGHSAKGPSDGVYIWCRNERCTAQEVFGHGKDEKDAWERVQLKFVKRESRK